MPQPPRDPAGAARVVDDGVRRAERTEHLDRLVVPDPDRDADAAALELPDPVVVHRPLVEPGELVDLRPLAGDGQRTDTRPHGRAVAHDARAPVDHQLEVGPVGTEVPTPEALLREAQRHDLGVQRAEAGGEHDVDAHRHELAGCRVDDDRGERPAVAGPPVLVGQAVGEGHALGFGRERTVRGEGRQLLDQPRRQRRPELTREAVHVPSPHGATRMVTVWVVALPESSVAWNVTA
jgi:hypothetical protein